MMFLVFFNKNLAENLLLIPQASFSISYHIKPKLNGFIQSFFCSFTFLSKR